MTLFNALFITKANKISPTAHVGWAMLKLATVLFTANAPFRTKETISTMGFQSTNRQGLGLMVGMLRLLS